MTLQTSQIFYPISMNIHFPITDLIICLFFTLFSFLQTTTYFLKDTGQRKTFLSSWQGFINSWQKVYSKPPKGFEKFFPGGSKGASKPKGQGEPAPKPPGKASTL